MALRKHCIFNHLFLHLLFLSVCLFFVMIVVAPISHFKPVFAFVNIIDSIDNNDSSVSSFPSSSPSFGMQEIENKPHNWMDAYRGISSNNGSKYTDIRSINYFSNGRFLNATLWLHGFNLSPSKNRQVNYGIYIDSDFNNKTGIDGIDYKIEINWNPTSKSWTRVFEQWSTSGNNRTISIEPNYEKFYQKGGKFVNLYADLKDMIYPQKYRILFYAEEIDGLKWIIDSTNWINIPPPKFIITAIPNVINVKAGEQKTIEIEVKSTSGFQPIVHFHSYDSQIPSEIKFNFTYENLQIPSMGEASTPFTVFVPEDAKRYPYTIILSANFSFPFQAVHKIKNKLIPTENVSMPLSIALNIQDPATPIDTINDFWNKIGGIINFVYLTVVAATSWIFTTYIKNRKKTRL